MSNNSLRIYTRTGCHLCDDARSVLASVTRLTRHRVVEVDIESDDALVRDFGLRIPVIENGSGRVLAEGRVEFGHLLWAAISSRLTGS